MSSLIKELESVIKKQIDPSHEKFFSDVSALFSPVFSSCEIIDELPSFAPHFLKGEGFKGFSSENCEEMAISQKSRFFWWNGRNKLIIWLIKKYFGSAERVLDIGCGTGFVTQAMQAALPSAKFYASDVYTKGLQWTCQRLEGKAFLFHMDAQDIPFVSKFDLITTFDVLEHIKDDERVLEQTHKALKPGGGVFHIVPQHPWLWSPMDDMAHHHHRYKVKELQTKLSRAGFRILYDSSFSLWLLPMFTLSRWIDRFFGSVETNKEQFVPSWMAALFTTILNVELMLIKMGIRWPVGNSRVVVAVKR